MRVKKMLENLAGNLAQLNDRMVRLETGLAPTGSANGGGHALEKFAVAAVEQQANQLGAVGGLLTTIANIGAERAARALGKRRAATARRDPRSGRMLRNACRLCENPNITDPQIEEIRAHATHGSGQERKPEVTYKHTADAIIATVPEELIQKTATGEEQLECPECGGPGKQPLPN